MVVGEITVISPEIYAGKTYNYCGKLGHIVANYRKLKNKKKKKGWKISLRNLL